MDNLSNYAVYDWAFQESLNRHVHDQSDWLILRHVILSWSRRIIRIGANGVDGQQRVPGQGLLLQIKILQIDLGASDALVVVESDPFLPDHYDDRAAVHLSSLEQPAWMGINKLDFTADI